MILIGCIAYPQFRTSANVRNVLTFAAIPLIVALGQTVVVLARGADLSVGLMIALSGAVLGELYANKYVSLVLTFAICIVMGIVLGAIVYEAMITKFLVSLIFVSLMT